MMKPDFKKYKMVAGEKIENKIYENRFNKGENYRFRDINEKRLPKWEIVSNLSERGNINTKHHQESQTQIQKFRSVRKNNGTVQNLHYAESTQSSFKPSLKQVEHRIEGKDSTPFPVTKVRVAPQITQELKIINENLYLLPHMRSITPNNREINVKHGSQFKNSEELDIINQMHSELPHMRSKTPNGRSIQQPRTHILSNETDFINQKKYLLPSMQNIPQSSRMALTERNLSQFTLAWDA